MQQNRFSVEVEATEMKRSYTEPWKQGRPEPSSASGTILNRNQILTNYHVIEDGHEITVIHKEARHAATVNRSSRLLDLAILDLKTPLADDIKIEWSPELPKIGDDMIIFGFPGGNGAGVSRTTGTVSRLVYEPNEDRILKIQTETAINPGNSGGPAVDTEGRVLGIVYSKLIGERVDNIGFVISKPVIDLFMDPEFTDVMTLGVNVGPTINTGTKQRFKLKTEGVVVGAVPSSVQPHALKHKDILLEANGHPISDLFKAEFRKGEWLDASWIWGLSSKKTVHLKWLRDGTPMEDDVRLTPHDKFHIPYDVKARCYIVGGLVFCPVTIKWKNHTETEMGARYRTYKTWKHIPTKPAMATNEYAIEGVDYEPIALSSRLPDPINNELKHTDLFLLKEVNGVKLKNLKHLKQLVEENAEEFLELVLSYGAVIYMASAELKAANARVEKAYGCANIV